MNFQQMLSDRAKLIEKYLDKYVIEQDNYQKNIYKSMRYSLFAGGKRIRPVLTLVCCEIVGGNYIDAIPFACAIEMIHTYSLIHDDLPAMDNDDYRRGKYTNHKVFGEPIAILAGDALLNKAFEVCLSEILKKDINIQRQVRALKVIANASGTEGMIGGQVIDIESQDIKIDKQRLHKMHLCKTGALIMASAQAGAIIGGATEKELEAINTYSKNIGLAFQIKDDILDVEGDSRKLGKSIGSDANNEKSTFVSLLGIYKAKQLLNDLTNEAIKNLDVFDDKGWFLKELASYLVSREN